MRTIRWLERHLPTRVWDNIATVSILGLLAVLSVFGFVVVDLIGDNQQLAKENQQRILDIQKSRVESCERTYEGIREVFRPLFPPKDHRTAEQVKTLATFNRTVDQLKRGCTSQTRP